MHIAIETGIPLPPRRWVAGKGRPQKYPWDSLKVGHSFFVPLGRMNARAPGKGPIINTYPASERTGFKFAMRSVVEDRVPGVRIWRTA